MELLAGVAFLLRKCFEKLGRSGIALFGGGLARRSEPLVPCGRLRGVACVIAHDAAPDAKDERSGAARVIDHDAAPRALDECGRATLPITTRPAARWRPASSITTRTPARLTNAAGRLCRSRHGRRRSGSLAAARGRESWSGFFENQFSHKPDQIGAALFPPVESRQRMS